ncbi:hypothetical protein [Pseudoalteromonas byunsanensis]|nr:hypothetical protein [Pseudoalteromonas byunsanensis]
MNTNKKSFKILSKALLKQVFGGNGGAGGGHEPPVTTTATKVIK